MPLPVYQPGACPACGGVALSLARCGNCKIWSCLECFLLHHCLSREEAADQFAGQSVLTCPASGCRLRRAETQNLTQTALDNTCTGPDRPCFAGCFRSLPRAWAWTGTEVE